MVFSLVLAWLSIPRAARNFGISASRTSSWSRPESCDVR
jgi:hypothetical protein